MKKHRKPAPKPVEQTKAQETGIVSAEKATEMVVPTAKAEKVVTKQITDTDVTALKDKIREKKSSKSEKADVTNTDAALQKIQYERDLKWLYPATCTATGDRKVFRQKCRNQIRRWEAQTLKLEGKAKEAKLAEIMEYRVKVLADPNAAV